MDESGAPPLGVPVWGDTLVELPMGTPEVDYTNLFTGERLTASSLSTASGQVVTLSAGELFAHFPVVLLRQELVNADERPL